ncbi:phosphoglycerate kinase [Wenzhouxiangella sp. XN79A]|nr:phosphoglycerate kinase [Wenzhouxiangella sp. XN79A]
MFEFEAFQTGTRAVAQAVAACDGFTLAGGGDTIAAIEKFHVADSCQATPAFTHYRDTYFYAPRGGCPAVRPIRGQACRPPSVCSR